MGEKQGAMFNIVVVVVIASIVIAVMYFFMPVILGKITDGMETQVDNGFGFTCDADGNCAVPKSPEG